MGARQLHAPRRRSSASLQQIANRRGTVSALNHNPPAPINAAGAVSAVAKLLDEYEPVRALPLQFLPQRCPFVRRGFLRLETGLAVAGVHLHHQRRGGGGVGAPLQVPHDLLH
nr:hypothetical protein Iba_chr11eCG13870 [Ipomoea batatas]